MEKIDGAGGYYRDVLQSLGRRDVKQFANDIVDPSDAGRVERLDAEIERLQTDPQLNASTVLVENVINGASNQVRVLSRPRELATVQILPTYKDSMDLPHPRQTYMVRLQDLLDPSNFQDELILAGNPNTASNIVRRALLDKGEWVGKTFKTIPFLLTPEDFILTMKDMIDDGKKISGKLLQYSGMREYYVNAKIKRDAEKTTK